MGKGYEEIEGEFEVLGFDEVEHVGFIVDERLAKTFGNRRKPVAADELFLATRSGEQDAAFFEGLSNSSHPQRTAGL